jgi:hypothetical protein
MPNFAARIVRLIRKYLLSNRRRHPEPSLSPIGNVKIKIPPGG